MTESDDNPAGVAWTVWTKADRVAILDQLDRILASPLMRRSKRYPKFLRHLVEQTLAGNEAELKERILGVTVFDRSPDYDTNEDTIVRISAGEVRRRLAQFYRQPEHAGQLEIDLLPGSYVPIFRRAGMQLSPEAADSGALEHRQLAVHGSSELDAAGLETITGGPVEGMLAPNGGESVAAALPGFNLSRSHWFLGGIAVTAILIAAAIPASCILLRAVSPKEQFWAPIDAPGKVQVVLGDISPSAAQVEEEVARCESCPVKVSQGTGTVAFRDILALSGIASFLKDRHKQLAVELSSQTSYSDLQHDSIVLIGGFNNIWSLRVTDPLRFHLVRNGSDFGIQDRQHPENGAWSSNFLDQNSKLTEDYGLIARVFDQTTGRPVLVVAGLGSNGTIAAANFLQDSDSIAELVSHAPKDWQHHNMEVVVRTQVLDNNPGPPRLVTSYFW